MNRFQRLVELRQIREETAANALARVQGRIQKTQEEIVGLDRETEAESRAAKENLASGCLLPPKMYEDFFRGQVWRRRRLEERKSRLQVEAQVARQAWFEARTLLQQAEKLALKDDAARKVEARRKEGKELDMAGILGASHSRL
ncbi:MAG: flagellar export protein FliJ [Magnetococcales bacterium]|nr:flagellar export protein FliJ [Magnetococcales bacterium]MBF0150829.1 flagellar export protein FliJ [Magnetococcales bacterium]MBF0173318.1 flagellar export protein FliJ [Magnetococcales bacterium]MBF0346415.1 flagellar export protein FliJ [Magnetococcales bacterium]MBF0630785.1 flagellar export protein FliJ [Magnetococcales bacterium]